MHGVKRDRGQVTAELKAQRKEREAKRLQVYVNVEQRFFEQRDADNLTLKALEATTELLGINPELYSAWNFRRRILLHLFAHSYDAEPPAKGDIFASLRLPAEAVGAARDEDSAGDTIASESGSLEKTRKTQLLQEDLELTMQALQMHPKVYWIWNHRKWCLQELPSDEMDASGMAKWTTELGMVDRMLSYDPRNFHGWDYRRSILAQLAFPANLDVWQGTPFPHSLADARLPDKLRAHQLALARTELAYTLAKIEANFSNFSAWHQRSLLLPATWTAERLSAAQARQQRDQEFELIRQAMFVDPDDQSVWTYHAWLVELDPADDVLQREIDSIRDLLELEPDSRWCMQALAQCLTLQKGKTPTNDSSNEARRLWKRLMVVDADRRHRYAELIGPTAE